MRSVTRNFLVTFIWIVSSSSILAQQVFYSEQDNTTIYFAEVVEQSAGQYALGTVRFIQGQNSQISFYSTVNKVDNLGVVSGSLILPTDFYLQGILPVNGNLIIAGSQKSGSLDFLKVIVVNSALQIIQTKVIDSLTTSSTPVYATTRPQIVGNRIFLLSSSNDGSGPLKVHKLDMNLNVMQQQIIKPNNSLFSNFSSGFSNLFVTAPNINNASFGSVVQVAKLDTSLNISLPVLSLDSVTTVTTPGWPGPNGCQQTKVAIFPFAQVLPVSPAKNIISGYGQVIYNGCTSDNQHIICAANPQTNSITLPAIQGKTGGSNEQIPYGNSWATSLKYNRIFHALTSTTMTIAFFPYNGPSEIMLTKTDTTNTLLWTKYFGDTSYCYAPVGITATSDSGVVVGGLRYNYVNPAVSGAGEAFLMKLEASGNILFTSIVEHFPIQVYRATPNPTSSSFKVIGSVQEKTSFKLIDGTGRIVCYIADYLIGDEISVINFPSGLYTFTVKGKSTNVMGKLIIQH